MKTDFDFGCVYFFKSLSDEILYIGKTYSLRNRFRQHLSDPDEWKKDIYHVEYIIVENEVDRDIVETYCINIYKPIYNKDKIFGNVKPTLQIELPKKEVVLRTDIMSTINKRTTFVGNFKKYCLDYQVAKKENNLDAIQKIELSYPFLKQAIEILGFDGIYEQKYNITNIKRKLLIIKGNNSSKSEKDKIKQILDTYSEVEIGVFISAKRLKEIFNSIYLELEIKKSAKSTDLLEFYDYQEKTKRVCGIVTQGCIPLCLKCNKNNLL